MCVMCVRYVWTLCVCVVGVHCGCALWVCVVGVCTDEILISYVNSAKNSLTVITHLYFLVYVSRNILH